MRILFIGQNGYFSAETLRALTARHEVVGVVESLPRICGPITTRLWPVLSPVLWKDSLYRMARRSRTPFFLLGARGDAALATFLKERRPDILCVASMSRLLSRAVFTLPSFGALNVHPALLPAYRGPQPLFWQYYFMEPQSGATVHFIDEGEDTGDIVKQRPVPIPLGYPSQMLMRDIAQAGAELLLEALDEIALGTVRRRPQKHLPCPFRARTLVPGEALIRWDWPLERIWHVLRGTGWQGRIFPCRWPGLVWRARRLVRGGGDPVAGLFRWRPPGGYLTHPEGRIEVVPVWSFKRMLLTFQRAVYRRRKSNRSDT